jgi:CubicO group peptidase (beta-lactamase class C family)
MPEWSSVQRKDFAVSELIDFFKYQPMQFAPGKRWYYNNSGYILLGAIIEKVSGQTYEEFVQQNIFDVLGMKHSYYDVPQRIIPGRASGYQKGKNGYLNAEYFSMTQAYGAGALASTLDDLAIWDAALYTEQLISQKTLLRAFTPYNLPDCYYGYGWFISNYQGHQIVEHGGGIPGFVTHAVRIPDERIFVAMFSNNEDKGFVIEPLTVKIATLTLGKPYQDPPIIQVSSELLASYEGVYQIENVEFTITCKNGILISEGKNRPSFEYMAISPTEFVFKSNTFHQLKFISNASGVVTGVERRYRLDPPLLAEKQLNKSQN